MRFCLATLFLSAPLFAQFCDFSVVPTSLTVDAAASTGQIAVTTGNGCGWSAASNVPWIKITSGSGYNSSGNAIFSVEANPSPVQRTGVMVIATKTVTITQLPAACNFAISPKSATVPVGGGSGSFSVSANCPWTANSNNGDFLSIPANTGGSTDGTVSYTVTPRTCVAGRTGSITINTGVPNSPPPAFTVVQDGSPNNLSLSATSATAGGDASDGRVLVATGTGCGWTAFSDVSWMQITSGSSGSGNGAIAYHLLANNTGPRTGSIHIGNLTYTVTQASLGPPAPVIASVNSAANYRNDAVSPGEIVTIFGSNMGPTTLVPLQVSSGAIAKTLSGTQVLFDGVAAPLIYTLDRQVSAVAPYSLAGKSSTQIQVVHNNVASNTMTLPVQASHPAIFSLDATGIGPGAILNQDNTINSVPNAAARGSIVAVYATGGGTTNPALSDGAVTGTTLPYLTQTVTATVGGVDARVTYAGGVPGSVAGLTQINVEIPAGVAVGPAVPVLIKIGNASSSPGVTIAVK
jgi:uncharacterized protein (TIGR03437 family)